MMEKKGEQKKEIFKKRGKKKGFFPIRSFNASVFLKKSINAPHCRCLPTSTDTLNCSL